MDRVLLEIENFRITTHDFCNYKIEILPGTTNDFESCTILAFTRSIFEALTKVSIHLSSDGKNAISKLIRALNEILKNDNSILIGFTRL